MIIKYQNVYPQFNGVYVGYGKYPYNPLNLPPYTIRLKYEEGSTPTFSKGTAIQVSQSPNVWDLTYVNSDWTRLLYQHASVHNNANLIEVLGANTTGVIKMVETFSSCNRLEKVALFDTSNVTTMEGMFAITILSTYNPSLLKTVPLFDTSKVSYMDNMFAWCNSLEEVPLFDTSSVYTATGMFSRCTSLKTIPLFNLSNNRDFDLMFAGCTSLINIPLFDMSSGTRAENMFNGCTSITTVPLFNTVNMKYMTNMFNGCTSLTTVPDLDITSIIVVGEMFLNCYNVEQGALSFYQKLSNKGIASGYHNNTFKNCGRDTITGSAELAQIPSDWGGTAP